jgi:hypothetical protein
MSEDVDAIRSALNKLDVNTLFSDSMDESDLINACITFLMNNGYKIIKPFNYSYNNVKRVDDLIGFFYAIYAKYHPNEFSVCRRKQLLDRNIAKHFIKARMNTSGISKECALKECAEIIEAVFMFEDKFKFEVPINFGLFGQDSLGWVTEKAVWLLNKARNEKIQNEISGMYDDEDDVTVGYKNLDKLIKKLEMEK